MSDPIPSPPAPRWDADLIFPALSDSTRRRMLVSLAARPLQAATELRGVTGKRLDATLKHLIALRAAKLVLAEDDPRDGRRMVYRLSPDVTVRRTETALELDFGCAVVRV